MNALMNIVLNVLSTFLSLTGWLRLMIAAAILLVAGSGLWFMQHEAEDHPAHTYWTCPMHPQIKEDKPGQCPICHMDLVAVKRSSPQKHTLHTGMKKAEPTRALPGRFISASKASS